MKKVTKKLIVLLLTLAMVISSFAACGEEEKPATNDTTTKQEETQKTENKTEEQTTNTTPAQTTTKVDPVYPETKTVSAAAATLAQTVQTQFGGMVYLAILNNAYTKMVTGNYATTEGTKAKVGDKNAKNVTLNLSVLYNKLRMKYTLADAYNAADGNVYEKGDFCPTWKQIQTNLGFTINDVTTTESSVGNNYKIAKANGFAGIDVLCASAASANEDGQTGNFIMLDLYLDEMPNFKKFIENNEVVKTTITAGDGHIYYAPYFDGYNDIEKTFLARIDWIKALLDGDYDASKFDSTDYTGSFTYTNYFPDKATGENAIEVTVVKADGSGVETIKKDYEKNITAIIAELPTKNGATLVKALRDYIDTTYNNYYGTTRSDLFCGQNAAWDADEFVALLRCVVANPQYLTGGDTVYGIFGREATLQRNSDLFTLTANLFGVRGADAEKDWLYWDAKGVLHDARQESDFYYAIEKFNQLYADGLVLPDFDKENAGGASGTKVYDTMYNKNLGFCLYDYVQTQTAYNNTVKVEGFDLESLINPVAYWATEADGTSTYTRFTESWRSVKTEGWVITAECAKDANKLAKALQLFDYMYSEEGNMLMSYGPDAWIEHDSNGKIVYIDYQGQQVPKLSEAALTELATLAKGNYTNYYRQYLGATFPIGYIKQQGMEYQCTAENGKKGLERINNAIRLGVIEHVVVNTKEARTPFYNIVPTTFATTANENQTLSETCANLSSNFSKTKGEYNIFIDAMKYGFEKAISNKESK